MSLPHFYLADDEYLDGVVGLNPTQEKHEVTFLFEPVSEKLQRYILRPSTHSCSRERQLRTKIVANFDTTTVIILHW